MSHGFSITRRTGATAELTYARMTAGAVGVAFQPRRVEGAAGARPDSFNDMSVSFSGEGQLVGNALLFGSNDSFNWSPVLDTAGLPVAPGAPNSPQHVKAGQFRLYRPAIAESADPAVSVNVEIHLTDRG